jgi:amino acid transporter
MNPTIRKPWARRSIGVVIGLLVAAVGAAGIAELSGFDIDIQLIAIVALLALGLGLLVSAATGSGRGATGASAHGWQQVDGTWVNVNDRQN